LGSSGALSGTSELLGLVVLVPEGRGSSGKVAWVPVVLEEVGTSLEGLVSPILRQPAKSVAVNTKISVMIRNFLIADPPVFRNTRLVLLCQLVLHPENHSRIRQFCEKVIFWIAFFIVIRYNRKS
jgi:hypothetical protein